MDLGEDLDWSIHDTHAMMGIDLFSTRRGETDNTGIYQGIFKLGIPSQELLV